MNDKTDPALEKKDRDSDCFETEVYAYKMVPDPCECGFPVVTKSRKRNPGNRRSNFGFNR